eukprot:jgi/Hompol1/5430/HPOL_004507-RA
MPRSVFLSPCSLPCKPTIQQQPPQPAAAARTGTTTTIEPTSISMRSFWPSTFWRRHTRPISALRMLRAIHLSVLTLCCLVTARATATNSATATASMRWICSSSQTVTATAMNTDTDTEQMAAVAAMRSRWATWWRPLCLRSGARCSRHRQTRRLCGSRHTQSNCCAQPQTTQPPSSSSHRSSTSSALFEQLSLLLLLPRPIPAFHPSPCRRIHPHLHPHPHTCPDGARPPVSRNTLLPGETHQCLAQSSASGSLRLRLQTHSSTTTHMQHARGQMCLASLCPSLLQCARSFSSRSTTGCTLMRPDTRAGY